MSVAARTRTALASAVVLALGTAGCGGGGGDTPLKKTAEESPLPKELAEQQLDWGACESEPGSDLGGSPQPMPDETKWQCASLKAPLDYAEPDGDTIDIALIRAASPAKGSERIGSLVFNFGGPGGSGVTTLPSAGPEYEKLHERFDLVSFDPRGVARSAGVKCLGDKELDAFYQVTDEDKVREEQREYVKACEKNSGDVLPYVTTTNTARDMDLMREVLGDDELYYFGVSYGTELGGVYAHLFPDNVGRAVLDAVVDPTKTPEESALGQAEGFQRALTNYLEACGEEGECPVGADPEAGEKEIDDLLQRLEKKPMKTSDPDGRELNASLAGAGIAQALYSQDFWEVLTEALEDAINDEDGSLLLRLSDLLNGRNQDGTYDNSQAANTAISCADAKPRYTKEDVEKRLPDFEKASPVFGELVATGMEQCTGWPVDGEADHPTVSAEGAEPIVVIGNTGDPATPYEGAAKMAEALGEDVGVELTYEGEGHGAYNSGDTCVQRHVNDYLLEGEVPEDGSTCKP